jgi:hypothetical protein
MELLLSGASQDKLWPSKTIKISNQVFIHVPWIVAGSITRRKQWLHTSGYHEVITFVTSWQVMKNCDNSGASLQWVEKKMPLIISIRTKSQMGVAHSQHRCWNILFPCLYAYNVHSISSPNSNWPIITPPDLTVSSMVEQLPWFDTPIGISKLNFKSGEAKTRRYYTCNVHCVNTHFSITV